MESNAPPAKRPRTDDGPNAAELPEVITRSEIWHTDGTVVLQAQRTQFRVHWGLLTMHSSVFKDIYTLPQPNVAGVAVEGCPVVEVHDDSGDWKHLLEVLYDGTILTEETLQFSLVAALIRLGRKYDFIKLLKAAVNRLTHDYPSTLALIDARQRADFSLNITPYPGIHFDVLSMAREHSILSVLPVAYYWMMRAYPQTSWFDGMKRPDGTFCPLGAG
ncbi:hypothetical protein HMN09_01021400 [Mycena chlorophos]|uniref:BTB domain-containing protein n=1 Tax=Mycena chlorophos TaxID=658473 RepID=A0A8H6VXT2_MYCCL|nr:hypothetical protein HMN09_01021400 [Mycena chlorophos]